MQRILRPLDSWLKQRTRDGRRWNVRLNVWPLTWCVSWCIRQRLTCFLCVPILSATYAHMSTMITFVKRVAAPFCVSTLHILPVSLVRGRDTRQSLFLCRSASAQINRPVKTCRVVVGPPRLSTGRRWHCFLVQPDNQRLGLGEECLVGLNVRRSTARMQPLLLITHDLCQLRNKSWLDFYL